MSYCLSNELKIKIICGFAYKAIVFRLWYYELSQKGFHFETFLGFFFCFHGIDKLEITLLAFKGKTQLNIALFSTEYVIILAALTTSDIAN